LWNIGPDDEAARNALPIAKQKIAQKKSLRRLDDFAYLV
jgi:hypothetical protein